MCICLCTHIFVYLKYTYIQRGILRITKGDGIIGLRDTEFLGHGLHELSPRPTIMLRRGSLPAVRGNCLGSAGRLGLRADLVIFCETFLVVSKNQGPQYRPQESRALLRRTPKTWTPDL